MKQKKLVYYFLIIAISLTLFLPILNLSFIYKNEKLNVQSFSKKQLYLTDNLESIINYFVYKTFNFSLKESQVIAGKDHFFFLGNGHVNIIDKTKGTYRYTNQEIDTWTTKLKKLQDWYEKQGIQFIIVVAPNKHTIYSDKLPDSILYKEGGTITDDIVKYALNKNIHILNLKKALSERKKDKQLFFRTDTHWNNYGAHIAYVHTLESLNIYYKKNYKMPEYNLREIAMNTGGDLTHLLKIDHLLTNKHEKDYSYIFKKKNKLCYGKITNTNVLEKCSPKNKNVYNQYVLNEKAPNKEKLMYISDSFGVANSELYFETFGTVWRFHRQYMHGDVLVNFVKKYRPDIIIYQVVERDLYTHLIVQGMP